MADLPRVPEPFQCMSLSRQEAIRMFPLDRSAKPRRRSCGPVALALAAALVWIWIPDITDWFHHKPGMRPVQPGIRVPAVAPG